MDNIRCIIVDDEPTAREIIQHHLEKVNGVKVVACCKNAMEAIDTMNKNEIDLIFLDINMPDMSGISLVKSMPKTVKVIFTTAYREYAVDGFDLQAVDYLLKPISMARLMQAVLKYRLENENQEIVRNFLVVRADRKMIKVNFDHIVYLESLSDYLKIHTEEKTIITRETISNIASKLNTEDFIRVHRSFIVSVAHISSYTAEYVEIQDKTLPVSRSFKNAFLAHMEKDL